MAKSKKDGTSLYGEAHRKFLKKALASSKTKTEAIDKTAKHFKMTSGQILGYLYGQYSRLEHKPAKTTDTSKAVSSAKDSETSIPKTRITGKLNRVVVAKKLISDMTKAEKLTLFDSFF